MLLFFRYLNSWGEINAWLAYILESRDWCTFLSPGTDMHFTCRAYKNFRVPGLTYILELPDLPALKVYQTCLTWWTDRETWLDGLRDMPDLMNWQSCLIWYIDRDALLDGLILIQKIKKMHLLKSISLKNSFTPFLSSDKKVKKTKLKLLK